MFLNILQDPHDVMRLLLINKPITMVEVGMFDVAVFLLPQTHLRR